MSRADALAQPASPPGARASKSERFGRRVGVDAAAVVAPMTPPQSPGERRGDDGPGWLSLDPAIAAYERAILGYSPVWMVTIAAVVVTELYEQLSAAQSVQGLGNPGLISCRRG